MAPHAGQAIAIPAAHHHIMIEQPIALVAALRGLLANDPTVGLAETVWRFNGFAKSGRDGGLRTGDRVSADPTVKPNPSLGAIERPPFHAVQLFPGDVETVTRRQPARGVIDRSDNVIDGPYAAGNINAPLFGWPDPGVGARIAASCVFAIIAVHDALQRSTASA
jgi:3-oxosteroid 1-dehydrogenase